MTVYNEYSWRCIMNIDAGVLTSLRHLSTSTSILTDPAGVPQQATDAVSKPTWSSLVASLASLYSDWSLARASVFWLVAGQCAICRDMFEAVKSLTVQAALFVITKSQSDSPDGSTYLFIQHIYRDSRKTRPTFVKIAKITAAYIAIAGNLLKLMVLHIPPVSNKAHTL